MYTSNIIILSGEEFCFSHHEFETDSSNSIKVKKSCKTKQMCQNEQLGCTVNIETGITVRNTIIYTYIFKPICKSHRLAIY